MNNEQTYNVIGAAVEQLEQVKYAPGIVVMLNPKQHKFYRYIMSPQAVRNSYTVKRMRRNYATKLQ